jgi:hypothetical protein
MSSQKSAGKSSLPNRYGATVVLDESAIVVEQCGHRCDEFTMKTFAVS